MRIVGIALVRNEDRFVEQSLRNVSSFCDSVVVADHMSTDGTWEIVSELGRELGNLYSHRIAHTAESHTFIEPYAGTDTWILSVDGDELYDPGALSRLRDNLENGAHDDVFRVRPAALHCDHIDREVVRASGYLSPPSRPLVGLLNFAAIDSWSGVKSQRLHGGDIRFRPGFDMDKWRHLGMQDGWDASPFRALHVCFLERSSADLPTSPATGRPNLAETYQYRRGAVATLERAARRLVGRAAPSEPATWKAEKYRRGDRISVEAASFFR